MIQEIEVIQKAKCETIVTFYGVAECEGFFYIYMGAMSVGCIFRIVRDLMQRPADFVELMRMSFDKASLNRMFDRNGS